jgi:magnesium transporter
VIESTKGELLANPTSSTLVTAQRIKRELVYICKSITPLRELLSAALRSESVLIRDEIQIYFRDIFDHILRITESIESHRDMFSGLLDIDIYPASVTR